ncbi:MAG: hypothetical protein QOG76_3913, partial [Pseudonocardiales bacterium]|nr:hypothetical protein [Pseudonocardiales bacterium]
MPSKVTSKPAEVADPAIEDTAESTTADTVAADTTAESTAAESTAVDGAAPAEVATETAATETAATETAEEMAGSDTAVAPTATRAIPRQRRRPSRWTMLVAGLSVLVVALWVAGGLLFAHNRGASQLAAQRQDVVADAQKVAGDLTSISSSNAQAQIQSLTLRSPTTKRRETASCARPCGSMAGASKDRVSEGAKGAKGAEGAKGA